jgi:hypothetical protein
MDDLLAREQYRDYSELVSIAVSNLHMLDQEVASRGAFVIGEGTIPSSIAHSPEPAVSVKRVAATEPATPQYRERKARAVAAPPVARAPFRVPDLFLFDGLGRLSIATLEAQDDKKVLESFTLDRWLFGQYNKLLPAKANCRGLARLMADQDKGVPLDSAATQIAEAAVQLGDYLADCDRRHQTSRDDALATAFPRNGPDAEKSRARYANQFVGAVNSQGQLSGLLWDYRFAALAATNPATLQLTAPGLVFARFGNPVLDESQDSPAQKFSREETAYLLEHVRRFIPVENFAFRTLIAAIEDGADIPEKLDEALRVHVRADSDRSLSPSFLTSQRSGALSRMADLGLIARVRKGVRVAYHVSEEGIAFSASTEAQAQKENA